MEKEPNRVLRLVSDKEPVVKRDFSQFICHICDVSEVPGCRTSMLMTVESGPMMSEGELLPDSGTKMRICVHCLAAGRVTIVSTI